MQLNIMNVRAAALVAQSPDRWALAGDQLYVDLDLSGENLPAGTRLAIGEAVIEVTPQPHTGCNKFVSRFGLDAMKFVNSPVGRTLNLRGINARVVQAGRIRVGDVVRRLDVALPTLERMPEPQAELEFRPPYLRKVLRRQVGPNFSSGVGSVSRSITAGRRR